MSAYKEQPDSVERKIVNDGQKIGKDKGIWKA